MQRGFDLAIKFDATSDTLSSFCPCRAGFCLAQEGEILPDCNLRQIYNFCVNLNCKSTIRTLLLKTIPDKMTSAMILIAEVAIVLIISTVLSYHPILEVAN